MKITSPVFSHLGNIPRKYTCDGDDASPPLAIQDVPKNAKTVAIIADDPDAPMGNWNHWLIWNIDPQTSEIIEDSIPREAVVGLNSSGKASYQGPCPPTGTHRYFFKLYALDSELNISAGSKRQDLLDAMKGHIIEEAELMGLYSRKI